MVLIRYFAGARQAAGVAEEKLTLTEPVPLSGLLERLAAANGPRSELAAVLPKCTFLVNEVAATDDLVMVQDSDQVDVLPPFAGG
jgi:molybdopterin converting factor small subunit